jgi:hypothetical protein
VARYRTSITSTLPADDAFALLADFSSAERWDPGVREAHRLDDGPLRVGSTFRVVSRFAGRDIPLDYEIIRFDAPEVVVLRAESSTIVSLDTITFESTPGGSTVTYDADLRLKGALRFLDPALAVAFGRIGDRARDGLRRVLRAR